MFDLRKIPMLRVLVPYLGGALAGLDPDTELEAIQVLIFLPLPALVAYVIYRLERLSLIHI